MSDTGFDELPADTSALLKEFAEAGFINVAGGCCGTAGPYPRDCRYPQHPASAQIPEIAPAMRLSGLEPFIVDEHSLFVNVGERTNVTGSKAFARLILNEQYDEALASPVSRWKTARRSSISIWMKRCWIRRQR
jgi:5-methyltetrahydrofolate--homocysteine methyltransferase